MILHSFPLWVEFWDCFIIIILFANSLNELNLPVMLTGIVDPKGKLVLIIYHYVVQNPYDVMHVFYLFNLFTESSHILYLTIQMFRLNNI